MKIAIAANSQDAKQEVSMQGARAAYYLIYDTESRAYETVVNPVSHAERRAGPQAAEFLISKKIDKVIAGNFGFKFRDVLEAGGVMCIEKTGGISKVIEQVG